jgi:hypothetical protein
MLPQEFFDGWSIAARCGIDQRACAIVVQGYAAL